MWRCERREDRVWLSDTLATGDVMMVLARMALTLVLGLSAGASAQAGFERHAPVHDLSRSGLSAIFTSMGMTVKDTTEPGGIPWLTVTTKEGELFNAFLYSCTDEARATAPCTQVQFRILWKNDKGRTAEDINRFHLEKVFGRGYITADKGMVGLEHQLHLTGGINGRNLRENITYFLRAADDFEEIVKP